MGWLYQVAFRDDPEPANPPGAHPPNPTAAVAMVRLADVQPAAKPSATLTVAWRLAENEPDAMTDDRLEHLTDGCHSSP